LSRPNIAITIKMLLAVLVSQLFNHQNMRKWFSERLYEMYRLVFLFPTLHRVFWSLQSCNGTLFGCNDMLPGCNAIFPGWNKSNYKVIIFVSRLQGSIATWNWYVAVALWIITGKLTLKPLVLTPNTYCNAPLLYCNESLQRCNDPNPVATIHNSVAMLHVRVATIQNTVAMRHNPAATTHFRPVAEQRPVATVHDSQEPG
jgi:hypothetical protein